MGKVWQQWRTILTSDALLHWDQYFDFKTNKNKFSSDGKSHQHFQQTQHWSEFTKEFWLNIFCGCGGRFPKSKKKKKLTCSVFGLDLKTNYRKFHWKREEWANATVIMFTSSGIPVFHEYPSHNIKWDFFFFFLKTLMEKYESLNSARSTIKFTLCQLLSKPWIM